jgi:hypothetical protein
MGSNVMLYLDDIQHTSPSSCKSSSPWPTARAAWKACGRARPRSYDMRGKRFAIVMAGNPYTESGEVFKIPDMLANRADIYNLGDVLAGREALFALSYIENSLTSNPALAAAVVARPADVHRLVRLAQGEEVPPAATLPTPTAAPNWTNCAQLLQRLFRARDLLLKVNLAYIESAAQRDSYRTEPPFKLQGSYRNMTKLAAKITAADARRRAGCPAARPLPRRGADADHRRTRKPAQTGPPDGQRHP